MFSSQTYCIQPDIVTGNGVFIWLPAHFGAYGERQIYDTTLEQSEKIAIFGRGFTDGGHPVYCAVGLGTQRIFEEIDTLSHARQVAPALQNGLGAFLPVI